MAKFKCGDMFAIVLPNGRYVCGRIMLDIDKQCVKPQLLPPGSPLQFFGKAVLVDVYRETTPEPTVVRSNALINGIFVDPRALQKGDWPIVGHEEVDPTTVEFPEGLIGVEGRAAFRRGEISLHLPLRSADVRRIGVYNALLNPVNIPDTVLYYLGLKGLINLSNPEAASLKRNDLRFSDHRAEVYHLLGEDPSQSYDEMSTRLGLNLSRFYA